MDVICSCERAPRLSLWGAERLFPLVLIPLSPRCLCWMTDQFFAHLLSRPSPPLTSTTLTDPQRHRRHLPETSPQRRNLGFQTELRSELRLGVGEIFGCGFINSAKFLSNESERSERDATTSGAPFLQETQPCTHGSSSGWSLSAASRAWRRKDSS